MALSATTPLSQTNKPREHHESLYTSERPSIFDLPSGAISDSNFPSILIYDRVLQELSWRMVVKRCVAAAPVVKRLNEVEEIAESLVMCILGLFYAPVYSSTGQTRALSQQFPLRLIAQVIPKLGWFD